ncbi:hypothetical protein ACHAWU_002641 [Discostella pseudostelligera]|uniref:Micro-fibrillar-associated protein 1 C-terminal domain-containing protein n=1 Tax=Discostella pseudostelligera TaxID=259834 RepID=A0ABD3LXD7_9STRA
MTSTNQNVGRDELAAMLGASYASDLIAAAGTTASDLAKKSSLLPGGVGVAAGGGHRRKHVVVGRGAAAGVADEEDISKMDRAQAAALVARKFAGDGGPGSLAGSSTTTARHRAVAGGKRKRMLQHHLLVEDLIDTQQQGDAAGVILDGSGADEVKKMYGKEDLVVLKDRYEVEEEEEEEKFALRPPAAEGVRKMRRAREQHAQKNQEGGGGSTAVSSIRVANGNQPDMKEVTQQRRTQETENNGDSMSTDIEPNDKNSLAIDSRKQKEEGRLNTNRNNNRARHSRSKRSSSSSSDTSSSSDSSSSSSDDSSSSSDESNHNATSLPMPTSKPLFVPKSKRGTVTELELQSQKHEEFEKRRAQDAEKRAIQSRALVAAAVSSSTGKTTMNSNEGDEFDTGEVGGEYIPVPDDTDPTEEDSPELVAIERNAWEVRELIRILRDVDEAMEREKERRELERRRALTDEERLEEDKLSGRYRAPGEARRRLRDDAQGSKRDDNNNEERYLQRFHHRGAFYMDEDTLNQAGEDDVRHRAAEYSRAATGEDKIDKSALPKVMQVKKFGFAGYSTKYKGLAKEDTTDKKMDFLPIRGHAPARSSGHGRVLCHSSVPHAKGRVHFLQCITTAFQVRGREWLHNSITIGSYKQSSSHSRFDTILESITIIIIAG